MYLLLFGLLDVVNTFVSSFFVFSSETSDVEEHCSTPLRGDKNHFWARRRLTITMMMMLFLVGRFGEAAS